MPEKCYRSHNTVDVTKLKNQIVRSSTYKKNNDQLFIKLYKDTQENDRKILPMLTNKQ